jgi:hypothetical protein
MESMVDHGAQDQARAGDEAAIRALLDRMGKHGACGDGDAEASIVSEDATS